uniref:Uncharacterized protein n=1 Tax=Rhizophora mucronata TaxID=61149 RepID=A0A2P2LVG6_RHIMU
MSPFFWNVFNFLPEIGGWIVRRRVKRNQLLRRIKERDHILLIKVCPFPTWKNLIGLVFPRRLMVLVVVPSSPTSINSSDCYAGQVDKSRLANPFVLEAYGVGRYASGR